MTQPEKVLTPCPSCGAKLAAPSTAAGKKIRCPKCQTIVAITADMLNQPPEMVAPPASVPQSAQRPEVSLGGENTFAGAPQQKYAPESLGDQATFGGKLGSDDVVIDDDMEIVDLTARYTIEGTLGKGGMGEVQLATDNRLKRKVAIKRVLGDMAKSQTAVRRFMTEAQSIAALNHPNIVQVYDYGRDKDGPFLILEYVDGKSLLDKCYNNPLSVEEAVDLICQVCDGLGKAHDAGIIHRDLKPANVLLTKDGVPKLTDFGLARVETGDTGQTMSGAVLGTLDFMPPEQRRDATQADARSDLWSLAATLYQMVTGKTPKIIKFKDVPQSLQDVLGKALEDEKDDRFQTAREFRDALRQVMDESRATLTDLAEGQCPSCGTKNEANRKFCRKCAVSLEVKCLSCSKGMPVWDEICGSCGTKQSPLITSRKEQLQQRQFQAEGFLQEGKFREATQIAEELQNESDPRFQHVKKWSAEFTEGLRREQQQQQQRSGILHQEAKAHEAAHDYSSAIHTLEQIPPGLRSPEISELLNYVKGQEERSKSLYEEIRLRVERRELDGLMIRVDELLQLVPDRVDLRDLRDKLEKRDQQRQAARSSAILEANRLMDARKYAECVAVLQSFKGSLRTPEIEALLKDAAAKQSQLEKLQQIVDQAVKNKQLQGLLAKVDELLFLKSDASEGDKQLREQLVAREQNQKSQIKALLQKVHQLRKEARFDKAIELLVGVPLDLRTDAVSASIEELIDYSEQRSAVLQRLKVAGEAEQIRKELSRAERYRELLASADITDVEFESALQGCRVGVEESQRTAKLAIENRQWMVFTGSVVCATLLFVVAGVSIQRQQRPVATAETQPRSNEAAHTLSAEKQRQANIAAAAEKQRQANIAAAAEKQRQANIAAAAEKQRQANIAAAAEKQRQVDIAAAAEKQRQVDIAAAAEKQRQVDIAAVAEKQRQVDIAAVATMEFKLIPAGEFVMGSSATRGDLETAGFVLDDTFDKSDEQPAHAVKITNPFYMGIHEVTRGQFAAFVNDTGYQTQAEKDGKGRQGFDADGNGAQKPEYNWKDNGMSQTDSHPVVNVSWNDAVEFIKWLSKKDGKQYRLPTEAEWEYCCRAGSATHFSSGDSLASQKGFGNMLDASYKAKYTNNDKLYQPFPFDDGFVYMSPVGQFKANKFGLYDMHGNVVEWCSDWYGTDYYATSPPADPAGATSGSLRVGRGGSWRSSAWFCRSAYRTRHAPSFHSDYLGFRLALSPSGQ